MLTVLSGYADEFGDDVHRQLAREFGDEVETLALQCAVEVRARQFQHSGFEFADPARSEPLGHQGAQSQMPRIVHCQEGHGAVGVGCAGDRVEGNPQLVGQIHAVTEPRVHVGVPAESPEVQLVIAIERGLVAQALVVRVGVFVKVVAVGIQHEIDAHALPPGP